MKKALLILAAVFLLGILGLFVFAAFFAPLDLIKNYASSKLEEQFGLPVTIEDIGSDLFSGIKISGVKINNPPGFSSAPLLSIDKINLKYNLWAILTGKLTIGQIDIINPAFSLEKDAKGISNLNLKQKKKTIKKKESSPVNLLISGISVKGGRFVSLDRGQAKAELKDLQIKAKGMLLSMLKPMRFSSSGNFVFKGKEVPLSLSSHVGVDLKNKKIEAQSLVFAAGTEKLSGTVTAELSSPALTNITFALASESLSVENLLGVLGAGAAAAKTTASKEKSINISAPKNIQAQGTLSLKNLYYKNIKIVETKIKLALKNERLNIELNIPAAYNGSLFFNGAILLAQPNLGYQIQALALKNFDAATFSKDFIDSFLPSLKDKKEWREKFHGQLSFYAAGSGGGIKYKELLKQSGIQGSLSLKNGRFARLKSLEEIAKTLKTPSLAQDLVVKEFSTGFKLYNGTLLLGNASLQDTDIQAKFNGSADLINLVWQKGNVLLLTFAPSLASQLPKEFDLLKNPKGEAEIELELTGSLKKPVPVPKIDKPVQRAIEKIAPQILKQIRERLPELPKDSDLEEKAKQELKKLFPW